MYMEDDSLLSVNKRLPFVSQLFFELVKQKQDHVTLHVYFQTTDGPLDFKVCFGF